MKPLAEALQPALFARAMLIAGAILTAGIASADDRPQPAGPSQPGSKAATNGQPAQATALPATTVGESSQARLRFQTALSKESRLSYLDAPLSDVAKDLADRHAIPILIDIRSLEEIGLAADTPIAIQMQGVSLRSGLKVMLRALELTYVIENDVILITTMERAQTRLRSRCYSVSPLLSARVDGVALVNLITRHISPSTWSNVGGPGQITFVKHLDTLVITQTDDVLGQIDKLLAAAAKRVAARQGR